MFVAGCVRQVAPGADIRVYRAVDSDGIGSEVRVACEMIRAVKQDGARIVNLSLGCQTPGNVPPVALRAALEIIGEWERETGQEVLIVAAAGNFGDTAPCWPAAFRRVVSVAALTPDLAGAPWSTSGPAITCSTIGQGVYSTFVTGKESPQLDLEATVSLLMRGRYGVARPSRRRRSRGLSPGCTGSTDTRSAKRCAGSSRRANRYRGSARR